MSPSTTNQAPPQTELQTIQPTTSQSMTLDPTQSSSTAAQKKESQDQEMRIRGGDRGGMCPGRFCFIIPCPLPCDCCII